MITCVRYLKTNTDQVQSPDLTILVPGYRLSQQLSSARSGRNAVDLDSFSLWRTRPTYFTLGMLVFE